MEKIKYPVNDPRSTKGKVRRMLPELIYVVWVAGAIIYAIFWIISKFN